MPVVCPEKIEDTFSLNIQGDVFIFPVHEKKVGCVIPRAGPVIRTAHVSTHTNALLGQQVPHPESIVGMGNTWQAGINFRLLCHQPRLGQPQDQQG
ncbi:hypothetical protein D3C86_1813970 [compost metagenome]